MYANFLNYFLDIYYLGTKGQFKKPQPL